MFNSLKYAKILEESGLPRKQAEAHIEILSNVMGEDVATKQDIRILDAKIDTVEASLKKDISILEEKMNLGFKHVDAKLEKLQYQLIVKLGALMAFLFGSSVAVLGLMLN